MRDPAAGVGAGSAGGAGDWLEVVRAQVADIAGYDSPELVDPDAAFVDMGFVSLAAVELSTRLEAATGLALPLTLGFDHPTPRALAGYLAGRLGGPAGERTAEPAPAGPPPAAARAEDDPMVIVGMSCRYPGGVRGPDDLWELVASGTDAVGDFPADRNWDLDRLYDPDPDHPGTSSSRQGGFLPDAGEFDAGFFGISDAEAVAMDPQQRLLLELGWELFERAGIDPAALRGSRTGVYVGVAAYDYFGLLASAIPAAMTGYFATGTAGSVASGRLAYVFGLEGPALTVDTACSSSLVALHLACAAVRQGECDSAVAGGVTVLAAPTVFTEFSRMRGLSPDGRCRSYAAAAAGTGFSEGAGLVLVERLSRARELGHRVFAVVRGSAVNSDGASNGLSAPNGPSQERVIAAALAAAGLRPQDVDAVEGHGTATVLGDPIEAQAILALYGRDRPADRPLRLGSLKSNIGHCQAAAGIGGVLKMVLALQHGVLPPTLHVDAPTPKVDWSSGAVSLLTEAAPWPGGDRPRRAGVSGFGFSGTNAHVVLEEPPAPPAPAREAGPPATAPSALPWVLSGKTGAALSGQLRRLAAYLAARPGLPAGQVARALADRPRFAHRAVLVGADRDELLAGLRSGLAGAGGRRLLRGTARAAPGAAVLFPGQGSQRPGMGRELAAEYPVFAAALEAALDCLDPHLDRPLRPVMWAEPGSPEAALLSRTEFTQPALFALEVALFRLVTALGVRPVALLGHSIGELAAAHVAGVFDLAGAARLVAARGRLMGALPAGGGMVAVQACEEEVLASLAGRAAELALAAVNGPRSVVVSGAGDALADWSRDWRESGGRVRSLRVSHAFHSPLMEPMLPEFRRVAAEIPSADPDLTVVSTIGGEPVEPAVLRSPDHWVAQARRPVRFAAGMRWLESSGIRRYLEVGPDGVLSALGRDCLDGGTADAVLASAGRAGAPEVPALLTALGALHVDGGAVDWAALPALATADPAPLPTYAFQRRRYWAAPAAGSGGRPGGAGHPLVGPAVSVAGADGLLLGGRVSLASHPWLADHAVAGTPLLSGTTFVELALRAGAEAGCATLAELAIEAPLVLPATGSVELQVRVDRPGAGGTRPVQVWARPDGSPWVRHALGTVVPGPEGAGPARPEGPEVGPWPPPGAVPVDLDRLYADLAAAGLDYGPAFRRLRAAWRRGGEVFAEVAAGDGTGAGAAGSAGSAGGAGGFVVDPAALDAALHVSALAGAGAAAVPFAWTGVRAGPGTGPVWRVRVTPAGEAGMRLVAENEAGAAAVAVAAVLGRPLDPGRLTAGESGATLLELRWVAAGTAGEPVPLPSAAAARRAAAAGNPPGAAALVVPAARPDAEAARRAAVGSAVRDTLVALQEWLGDPAVAGTRLVVVTRCAAATRPGEVPDPAAAAVWGLVRTAQTEHPDRFGLLDVPADAVPDNGAADHAAANDGSAGGAAAGGGAAGGGAAGGGSAAAVPVPAAVAAGDQPQAAVRDGALLVPRLRPTGPSGPSGPADAAASGAPAGGAVPAGAAAASPAAGAAGGPWTAGTVLVTGGTGGLGALVAGHLVDAHGARDLLLVSRRGGAADGAERLRADLTARGARVTVAACDVGDPAQLDALLAGVPPDLPLSAVVHAAGVLDDGVLESLTGDRVERVLAPKAGAALLLDERTRTPAVGAFVLFSSLAGIVGTAGQASYAAANACLDAVAARRRAAGLPATSLAWGRWLRLSGMTAGLTGTDSARLGEALSDRDGLALLDAALARQEPVLVPVRVGPEALRAAARAGRLPSVLRDLAPAVQVAGPAGGARGAALRDRLERVPPADRLPVLLELVRADVTAVLGADPTDRIDPDLAFRDVGLDSLKMLELRNRLSDATGLPLPATVTFEQPTPRALAGLLLEQLTVAGPVPGRPPTAAARPPEAAPPAGPSDADTAERIRTAGAEELAAIIERDLGVRLE
ncbi:MAG: type I polyketide synthase [Mycobacteriales bacterium]